MSENNLESSEIVVSNPDELEKLKNDKDKVFNYSRSKFEGFGTYGTHDINERVNTLMKQVKKEFPTGDNWMLWIATVDYILKDELKIDINADEKTKEWYDNFLKEKDKREYQNVQLLDENNNPTEVKK